MTFRRAIERLLVLNALATKYRRELSGSWTSGMTHKRFRALNESLASTIAEIRELDQYINSDKQRHFPEIDDAEEPRPE